MSTHNICLYKEVDIKYTGCNLKTMELLDYALIGVCAVIRSNTVCTWKMYNEPVITMKGQKLPVVDKFTYLGRCQDLCTWCYHIRKGADDYKADAICESERKHHQQKARASASPSKESLMELYCTICNRQFGANFGLFSHQRTHGSNSTAVTRLNPLSCWIN